MKATDKSKIAVFLLCSALRWLKSVCCLFFLHVASEPRKPHKLHYDNISGNYEVPALTSEQFSPPPQATDAFGAKSVDDSDVRMLLDQAVERGIRDIGGIEARSFGAGAIGAPAAQRIEAVADFDQKRADFAAGKNALQAVARRDVAGLTGLIEQTFAPFERGEILALADLADAKAAIKLAAAVVVTL